MNLEQQLEQHKKKYKDNLHYRRFILMVFPLLQNGELTAGELKDAITLLNRMLKTKQEWS